MATHERTQQQITRELEKLGSPRAKAEMLNEEAWALRYINPNQAVEWARQARSLALMDDYKRGEARAWHVIGVANALLAKHEQALNDLRRAWEVYDALGERERSTEVTANIATVYLQMAHYDIALEWQFKALRQAEQLELQAVVSNTLTNIAIIYAETRHHDQALEYHQRALELKRQLEDDFGIVTSLNAIGEIYHDLGRLVTAMEYQEESLACAKSLGVRHAKGYPLLNIGRLKMDLGEYPPAREHFGAALEIFREVGNRQAEAQTLISLAELLNCMQQYPEALNFGQQALDIAWDLHTKSLQARSHKILSQVYRNAGQLEQAFNHLERHSRLQSEVLRLNASQTFQTLNRQHQAEQYAQEKEIYRLKNIELNRAKQSIQYQKEELEEALTQIEASIKYASRIQRAMLPVQEDVAAWFADHFVLYLPREGVSGDFFWLEPQKESVLLAAADCTGHGVPGALMSMLGYSLLKQIVLERGYTRPDKILKMLDLYIRKVLCRGGSANNNTNLNDGMDISLIHYTPHEQRLEFSGAYNPLYHVRKGELTQLKANRHPIGGSFEKRIKPFSTQSIATEPGDVLYLFSDGFADQFGRVGNREKKFSYRRFRELLTEISSLPMAQQRSRLVEEFSAWKGSQPQLDDVLVLGVRL